ncbi:UNVERIFIED_CONTAM: hypothetical protein FKN15_044142 [Acipenser sinensis]
MKCLREKGQGPRIDQYFLRSQSSQSNEIQRQEANHSSQDISTPVIDVRRTCMDTVSDEPNDPCEPVLSITTSEEGGEQELAFPSEDVESDSTSPAVKLSLSAELLPLIKRATAVLQMPWPTEGGIRQFIFDDESTTSRVPPPLSAPDFLFEIQVSWGHPATAPALSQLMDTLYRVHDVEKLGLAQLPPVEASIAALVEALNLVLLYKTLSVPTNGARSQR